MIFVTVGTRENMIAAPKWYDSIRKHLADCDYHTGAL